MTTSPIVLILRQTDLFYELSTGQLELIAALCEERVFNFGDIIFRENDLSDELYIIAQGEVDIQVEPSLVGDTLDIPSGPVTITTLRRGQNFGEVALVDQGLRSATARCSMPVTRLIVVPRDRLMKLCDAYPELGYRLMRNLAGDLALKVRNTDLHIREQLLYGKRNR